MKISGNIPIDNEKSNEKLREVHKNRDIDNKDNANKADDSKDKISLSGEAKEINELKRLMNDLPDMRSDRIDALKKAIEAGNYNIDANKIAEKILEEL
jgi:negative regulator of flagellin synthesis FlgM